MNIPARVLDVPGFRMDKYMRLRREGISFVSDNCWGGLMYHTLRLEMQSPLTICLSAASTLTDCYAICPGIFLAPWYRCACAGESWALRSTRSPLSATWSFI